jgi:hypothetical protein
MKVPDEVKQFTANARLYLEAAFKFPPPTNNAVHILLLIYGWENVVLADSKVHAWAMSEDINPKLLRDHETKLNKVSKDAYIQHFINGEEVRYSTGIQLKKLREICMYGLSDDTKNVANLFREHWFSDNFSRSLKNKVEWTEMSIKAFEALDG